MAEADLLKYKSRREHGFRQLQILYDLGKQMQTDRSKCAAFRARYKDLELLKEEYYQLQDKINNIKLILKPKESLNTQQLSAFDELYYEIITFAEMLGYSQSNSNVVEKKVQIRLPKIETPKFNGQIENWQTFIDSYLPLIHQNETLSTIEKFHYLITCLSGPALAIAKGVPLTANNYNIVFNALMERYQNDRVLAITYLDKITSLQPVTNPTFENLTKLINILYESINALKAMNIKNLDEFLLFYLASRTLDPDTKKRFELQNAAEIPTSNNLLQFLQNYIKVLETCKPSPSYKVNYEKSNSRTKPLNNQSTKSSIPRSFVVESNTTTSFSCPCCKSNHSIYKCLKFQGMSISARLNFVNINNLCHNCLRINHATNKCPSKTSCLVCGKRHSTLLHADSTNDASGVRAARAADDAADPASLTCVAAVGGFDRTVRSGKLLGSVQVCLLDNVNNTSRVRGLVDSCSHDSFITTACARRLGLHIRRCNITVAGLGHNKVNNIKGVTSCIVTSQYSDKIQFKIKFIVLSKITSNLPSTPLPINIYNTFKHLNLADKTFHLPGPIEILLGVEVFDQIYDGGRYTPGPGLPVALNSVFGWVISGQFDLNLPTSEASTLLAETCALEDVMKRFWETEEPPCTVHLSIPENDLCEQIYTKYKYRNPDGRYVVPMLLDENSNVGESHKQGLTRFLNLEKRLLSNSELREDYITFMREYETLGHMSLVSKTSNQPKSYIIPHHCVLRPGSTTTKLRVVFDASCRSSNSLSLNDIIHPGPKLQADIIDIITKFRLHTVVFTSDICKMYRQILLRPEDQRFQHILWRESPSDPLQEYELKTVTYGVRSSPYLALRTLRQLASDEGEQFPRAAETLREETFVDDIITGAPSLQAAIELRDDLIQLLQRGQFELRKWSSNDPRFLADLRDDHCQLPKSFFDSQDDSSFKILGIKWDPVTDAFSYSYSNSDIKYTKRSILSTVARIYDPLGWISPLVFSAKVVLQQLWTLNLSWDDDIPANLAHKWNKFVVDLTNISKLNIPRFVQINNKIIKNHLVGFCDGSSKGFGCCVYLVVEYVSQNYITLLIGKSKVAPLKTLTVNRLELCGAVLLSRVLRHMLLLIREKIPIDSVLAYTDSGTVLAWLHTAPHLLKIFVANRVVQILDNISLPSWQHVSTADNPADCSSRGVSCPDLIVHPLWWSGPEWLRSPSAIWPTRTSYQTDEALPEQKTNDSLSLLTTNEEDFVQGLIEQFSSLTKLQRTVAWCLRFINNLKCKTNKTLNKTSMSTLLPLTVHELNLALILLIRKVQYYYFKNELKLINNNLPCNKQIQKLAPFLDTSGMLRVGGRIINAPVSKSIRHPILLPKLSHLSNLIITHFHITYLHCGPRTLQSLILRTYWILGIKLRIRSILSKCVVCFKAKPVCVQPSMGVLPAFRLQPQKCFDAVGIDLGGPIILKEGRRRNSKTYKAYFCVFVCLSVKAIHIEPLTELSTEAFIATLDRFVARRGICSEILSDCGTNFVGSKHYLSDMYKAFANDLELSDKLSGRGIKWKFNPPGAPHFGGIFESGIRATKYHLKRVVGNQTLTLEEFLTILAKIEAMLNSRPICAISNDPGENDVLTPGHFIIGGPLVALPEPHFEDQHLHPRSRWQMLQKITQSFWRTWQRDYLHTLQQRAKWFISKPNININDLVILVEPNLPPLQWRLGRVQTVHPGSDGVVRVVTVKTTRGILRRPVVKICPLPIN